MRCLMCHKNMNESSWKDIFLSDDPLCSSCRKEWKRKKICFDVEGIKAEASYVYDPVFSSYLIQYKECNDEALKDVFLFENKNYLRRKYRGYTLCLMPSSVEKYKQRGFSHLKEMFSCLKMDMLEPFEKEVSVSQKKLPFYLRKNLESEIRLKESVKLPRKLLLCDDTITSGSTLKGALHCLDLKKHEVRIYCVSANRLWL